MDNTLPHTTCTKGHVHPPWNTTGLLHIAKCESVCGFCQKETKTAANLRKHVAIHIKNEGLNLAIAEGLSGRGRLEMPAKKHEDSHSQSSNMKPENPPPSSLSPQDAFAPSQALMSMHHSNFIPNHNTKPLSVPTLQPLPQNDPFTSLRARNIATKIAWTMIPSSQGFRVLKLCKSLSATHSTPQVNSHSNANPNSNSYSLSVPNPNLSPSENNSHMNTQIHGQMPSVPTSTPCYNRETIFDEEWQAHMKDVHGVFWLWPETWMKRIEVLDLDAFGGDIAVCNEILMDGRDW